MFFQRKQFLSFWFCYKIFLAELFPNGFFMKEKELPEASLIRNTFVLRIMDLPPNIRLTKRSLLRWFALSFGLLSENESRTTVLEVLDSLFYLCLSRKMQPTTIEIQNYIKQKHSRAISEKLLRYHLNRVISSGLLLRKKQRYSFNPSPYAERDDLKAAFNFHVSNVLQKNLSELEEVFHQISESYKK